MRWRDEPTPSEVRRAMREIFEREEFQRSKNPIRRVLDKIIEWLSDLLGGSDPGAVGAASGWGGPIGTIIVWVGAILLLIALAVVIRLVVRNWRGRVRPEATEPKLTVEDERDAGEWATAAEQFEAAGNWKDAIRCRYRELVARLVELQVVSSVAGRSTGELRQDVVATVPAVAAEFSAATDLFELPWYADLPTGPEENARFRSLATAVLTTAEAVAVRRSKADAPRDLVEVGA